MNISDGLNQLRVLLFVESEEGTFEQVMLTPQQYKRITEAIIWERNEDDQYDLRHNYEAVCMRTKDGWSISSDAFIGLASTYEE